MLRSQGVGRRLLVLTLISSGLLFAPRADACVVEFHFTPTSGLQMVLWIEDDQGNFVDTLFITRMTGSYGLGNRPGDIALNSQWRWPYGRRENTFPVWAHRHNHGDGGFYPRVVFQDGDEPDLSHAINESSIESFYCRPVRSSEPQLAQWIDANSCATVVYTDKGKYHPTARSHYPPRNDMTTMTSGVDHPDLLDFSPMNDLDAVSRSTPLGGVPYVVRMFVNRLPPGRYVAYLEVSKEFDPNEFYAQPAQSACGWPWSDYGEAYWGQPSVVYSVAFDLDGTDKVVLTEDFAGYGDPGPPFDAECPCPSQTKNPNFGQPDEPMCLYTPYVHDGELRAPDGTITTGVEGSGAGRLLLESSSDGMYRFKVSIQYSEDMVPPGEAKNARPIAIEANRATIEFTAPGDDGDEGTVTGYEVRVLPGTPLTDENFYTMGQPVAADFEIGPAGTVHTFTITGLMPQTRYWVGIRATDDCLNNGPLHVFAFDTPRVQSPPLGGCAAAPSGSRAPGAAAVALVGVILILSRRRRIK